MLDDAQWSTEDAEALRVAVGRFVRAGLRHSDIPVAQARVLGVLDRDGAMTIADLAQRMRIRHQSARETVALLLRQALISTARSPDDARKTICSITVAGRARLDADRQRRTAWILASVRRLAPQQRRAAMGIAEILDDLAEDEAAD